MLNLYVDLVCLTYHEGRNVRHLIKQGHLDSPRFDTLRSLPTNRDNA